MSPEEWAARAVKNVGKITALETAIRIREKIISLADDAEVRESFRTNQDFDGLERLDKMVTFWKAVVPAIKAVKNE